MEKTREEVNLEFDEVEFHVRDWIKEQPRLIQTQINGIIRLMAKHSNGTVSSILDMYCDDFFRNLEEFKKKKRLQTKYDFLEMK